MVFLNHTPPPFPSWRLVVPQEEKSLSGCRKNTRVSIFDPLCTVGGWTMPLSEWFLYISSMAWITCMTRTPLKNPEAHLQAPGKQGLTLIYICITSAFRVPVGPRLEAALTLPRLSPTPRYECPQFCPLPLMSFSGPESSSSTSPQGHSNAFCLPLEMPMYALWIVTEAPFLQKAFPLSLP